MARKKSQIGKVFYTGLRTTTKNRTESKYNRDYSAFFRRRWIYRNNILKNEYRFYLSYFSVKIAYTTPL